MVRSNNDSVEHGCIICSLSRTVIDLNHLFGYYPGSKDDDFFGEVIMIKFIFSAITACVIAFSVVSCGGDQKVEKKNETQVIKQADQLAKTVNIDEHLAAALAGTEQSRTGRHDAIASLAKKDAQSGDPGQYVAAIEHIRTVYPNFYKDAATMEKTLYYGYLLDYLFQDSDPRSKLGWDTVAAIKYVYRGHEKVEDEAPQNRLKKIKMDLQRL